MDPVDRQPSRSVVVAGTTFDLLGTAHVSRASADAVADRIRSGDYDAVAVELCASRHASLIEPDSLARMDLFRVVREGRAGMVAASLALGAYQERLAEQLGVEPGAEMRAASGEAEAAGLPLLLIDRDVGITLRRLYRAVPWWRRMVLLSGLMAGLVSRERVSEADIERLKEGDLLETTFAEFAQRAEALYGPLIDERDRYMALRLRDEAERRGLRRVLAVVGAGHLDGLAGYLEDTRGDPAAEQRRLEHVPPPSRWPRAIPWAVAAAVLAGFGLGFSRSTELGTLMVADWVLINGGLSALGAALALAHPATVVGSFLAAPLTSLNPTIGAGFVAAAIELYFRRPRVGDFSGLRRDVARLAGWWQNRVARTLLVFLLASAGSAVGTYVAGFRIFERLL